MSFLSKTGAVIAAASFTLASITPIFAQEDTASSTAKPVIKRPVLAPKATAVKEKLEARKENVANKIQAVKDRTGAIKEKIASREAALKAKLEKFKDQRKAALTQKLSTNLNTINQNHTRQMTKHLEAMTAILAKLENRVNSGAPDIKNPDDARLAINSARAALSTATSAVSAQSENDYTVTVTSESKIKTDVKEKRDKLHTDLSAVRELVREAKKSVSDAVRTAKSGRIGETGEEEATASGQ